MAQPVFGPFAAIAIAYTALWNIALLIFNTRNKLIWRRCSHVNLVLVSHRKQGSSSMAAAGAAAAAGPPESWFAWDIISAKDVLSGPIGVLGLTLFRAFQFVVFLFTIVYGNILYSPAGAEFFIYFTNWTFVLFGLTGLLGTGLTAREWVRRRRPTIPCIESTKPVSRTHCWSPLLRFYHLLLTTTCSASIMLTIFYWFADYLPGVDLRFDNPVKHGASSLLLLLDVALSRVPLVSYHLQVIIAYGSVYLCFLWAYYGGTGTWVYRALDWTRFMSVPYYFALPLLLLLGFIILFSVAAVREVCIRSCTCRRPPQTAEDVVMAKEPGALPWVPLGAVVPSGLQGSDPWQAGQMQMSPRSPRLAIALQ